MSEAPTSLETKRTPDASERVETLKNHLGATMKSLATTLRETAKAANSGGELAGMNASLLSEIAGKIEDSDFETKPPQFSEVASWCRQLDSEFKRFVDAHPEQTSAENGTQMAPELQKLVGDLDSTTGQLTTLGHELGERGTVRSQDRASVDAVRYLQETMFLFTNRVKNPGRYPRKG